MTAGNTFPLESVFSGLPGEAKTDGNSVNTNPGNAVVVKSLSIAVGKKRRLWQLFLTTMAEGKMEVYRGANIIARGRTAAGYPNIPYSW